MDACDIIPAYHANLQSEQNKGVVIGCVCVTRPSDEQHVAIMQHMNMSLLLQILFTCTFDCTTRL